MWSIQRAHNNLCKRKQQERTGQIARVQALLRSEEDLHESDRDFPSFSIADLASRATDAERTRILMFYTSKSVDAQAACNCVADFLLEDLSLNKALDVSAGISDLPETCQVVREAGAQHRGILRNVPISLKDTVKLANHDTTLGLSKNAFKPASVSAPIVHLLQDAGALFVAKTTVPAGVFGIETESDLFGLTTNPFNAAFGVGASTGGGAALVAMGGSRIEVGSDVAGSLRLPAAFCGVYALKGSVGRFPAADNESTMPGLLSLPTVAGPIAPSLDDLSVFYQRVIEMCPWTYDPSCLPIPWRPYPKGRKFKWGMIRGNSFIPSSPASQRALDMVGDALRSDGHDVTDFFPPVNELLQVGLQTTFSDGGEQLRSQFSPGERILPAIQTTLTLYWIPYIFKIVLAFLFRVLLGDKDTAFALETAYVKTIAEERKLIVRRDELRRKWEQEWVSNDLDFVITVCAPFPGIENGTADKASLFQAGWVMLFSLLDYSAGVLPVTKVDKTKDALPKDFAKSMPEYRDMNLFAKIAYTVYDADKMHGLPVGVQIACRRLEEEKVLVGMEVVEKALRKDIA